jgi:hypothetical protein
MKKVIFLLLITCCSNAFAQNVLDYDMVKLEKPADCKAADPIVKQAANYILSTPFDNNNTNRTKSLSFVIKWLNITPDFSFPLDNIASKIMKDDNDLMGIYIAAMAKYCLENKAAAQDKKLVKLNALTYILDYCSNEKNNLKMTKPLKKLAEAKAKGELEQSL